MSEHNFGTFDDFCVKNDQKVSHNMILMSKYKGKHGGTNSRKALPPFRAMPERNRGVPLFGIRNVQKVRDNVKLFTNVESVGVGFNCKKLS